jgi:MoaA/NifB/PqqE/SkfB family radical SAM enzyme
MCECWQLPRSKRDIGYYSQILDAVLELRPQAIRFTGGEPLLLRGLPSLVHQAATRGVRVSVISNGRLLPTKAELLDTAGCKEIIASIDGVGATHDDIRGTPGLYDRCLETLSAIGRTSMTYGVNTVVQRAGIDDVAALAEVLLDQSLAPAWWHLIPVRDHPDLRPTDEQIATFQDRLPSVLRRCAEKSIRVVAEPAMFEESANSPCLVPQFAAYVRADTGEVFGCNMLAYIDGRIGNLIQDSPAQVWASASATSLRERCRTGSNSGCSRCDPASRAMNHLLRIHATQHRNGATAP